MTINKLAGGTLVAAVAIILTAAGAVASHGFPDVPDGYLFHDHIDWLADNGITAGFGDGTYRPDAPITRGQMAAFLRSLAAASGAVQDQATVFGGTVTSANSSFASVTITPLAAADVVLSGHIVLEVTSQAVPRYDVQLRRGSCAGAQLARGWWRAADTTDQQAATVAIAATDVVSTKTTYHLCADAVDGVQALVGPHGLVASWSPAT